MTATIEQYRHCCEMGRYGGLSKSDKKRAAARINMAKARAARKPRNKPINIKVEQ